MESLDASCSSCYLRSSASEDVCQERLLSAFAHMVEADALVKSWKFLAKPMPPVLRSDVAQCLKAGNAGSRFERNQVDLDWERFGRGLHENPHRVDRGVERFSAHWLTANHVAMLAEINRAEVWRAMTLSTRARAIPSVLSSWMDQPTLF